MTSSRKSGKTQPDCKALVHKLMATGWTRNWWHNVNPSEKKTNLIVSNNQWDSTNRNLTDNPAFE